MIKFKWPTCGHFDCNMRNSWKTKSDGLPISIEQYVGLVVGYTGEIST